MGKRFIPTERWDSPAYCSLSAETKALWQYIWDRCDCAGVIEFSPTFAQFFINGTEDISANLEKLEMLGWVESLDAEKLFVPGMVPFQNGRLSLKSPAHKPIIKKIEEHRLCNRLSNSLPLEYQYSTSNSNSNSNSVSKSKPTPKKFVPPTPAEAQAYAATIDYQLDGDSFVNSYAQKGWMVGKSKMKDWKAAVRNWKTNGWGKASPSRSAPVRLPNGLTPRQQREKERHAKAV